LCISWRYATVTIRDYFELLENRPAKSLEILPATGPKSPLAYIHRVEVGLNWFEIEGTIDEPAFNAIHDASAGVVSRGGGL
jgi:hypothetical protein